MRPEWTGFVGNKWDREVNTRDFIQKNYTPYEGDDSFLAEPTQNTKDLWEMVLDLSKKEREAGGVLDMDTRRSFQEIPAALRRYPYGRESLRR